mmetsp:Transcript_21722/g.37522  ORF Transcript_21722/g.37522 Transcript_21722/m.37522 type:complete len:230 (+) Transcript_21722:1549-2238(+)
MGNGWTVRVEPHIALLGAGTSHHRSARRASGARGKHLATRVCAHAAAAAHRVRRGALSGGRIHGVVGAVRDELLLLAAGFLLLVGSHFGWTPFIVSGSLFGRIGTHDRVDKRRRQRRIDIDALTRRKGHTNSLIFRVVAGRVGCNFQHRVEPSSLSFGDLERHLVNFQLERRHHIRAEHLPHMAPTNSGGVEGNQSIAALPNKQHRPHRDIEFLEGNDLPWHGWFFFHI